MLTSSTMCRSGCRMGICFKGNIRQKFGHGDMCKYEGLRKTAVVEYVKK